MRCITPLTVKNPKFQKMPWLESHIEVPCGKCPACRRRRSAAWCFRLLQEERHCVSSHFVTLTYDVEHLPVTENGLMTLVPSHLTDFWKLLRYYYDGRYKIIYYACGEYGSMNKRPHYHAIIFNCPQDLYVKAWKYGMINVGNVNASSVGYTTGYMEKPFDVNGDDDNDDRVKEFSRMSKNLGLSYLTKSIVNWYKSDLSRLYVTLDGGVKVAMPRYYRDKIFTDEERKVIQHYFYWSEKWNDDVRPSFDQVQQMYEKYRAKYRLAAKRRL